MAVPSKLTSYFNAGVPVIAATDEVASQLLKSRRQEVEYESTQPTHPNFLKPPRPLGEMLHSRLAVEAPRGLRFRHDTLSESAAISHYDDFINVSCRLAADRPSDLLLPTTILSYGGTHD